jgi:NAD(P)-dependent dehydrogenase (short-subunit alcohol dehydrogenase family)
VAGRLQDRVAIITGGANGIGAGMARRFVEEGATVIVADVLGDAAAEVAGALGPRAVAMRVDVTDEDDVAAAVDRAVAEFGRLDVMVNNAGILGATGSITTTSFADVNRTVAVILGGAVLGMKHAARVMVPQRRGVIITVSSPAGVVGGVGPHAYSAAKAAVLGLNRSVAAELRPHGVRVNAIIPGAIVSAMTAHAVTGDPDDLAGAEAALAADSPIGRSGLPADIAAGALYLASDDASFVTGHALAVDAGYSTIAGPSPFAIGELAAPGMMLGPTGERAPLT